MSNDASHDEEPAPSSSMGVTDVYYVLFRRKWLILGGLLLGLGAAAALWKVRSPLFASTAKIMVLGVRDAPTVLPGSPVRDPVAGNATLMVSEGEILTSLDVAREAANAVGPARIMPEAGSGSAEAAAFYISRNLKVELSPQLNVITLRSRHKSPDIALEMLEQVIKAYLKKHEKIHSNVGGPEDALSQKRQEYSTALTNAMAEQKALKAQVGIYSLEDFKKANTLEESKLTQDLYAAQADLAARLATLRELQGQKSNGNNPATNRVIVPKDKEVPPEKASEYAGLLATLETLYREDRELSSKYTKTNPLVVSKQAQIEQYKGLKMRLEAEYPALLRTLSPGVAIGPTLPNAAASDLPALVAQIPGLEARIAVLTNQLAEVRNKGKSVEEVEGRLRQLQTLVEHYQSQLNGIEKTLQDRQANQIMAGSNIQPVQDPSVPFRDFMALYKKMGMAVAGGLGLGLALAFLLEMIFDRSLRRPKDVENLRGLPFFLSIPKLAFKSEPKTKTNSTNGEVMRHSGIVQPSEELKVYHDSLRDRLVNHFEMNNLNHKPKMVAVTACDRGAGVSSVAAGLAASLSEIGEGNVLLVDMRGSGGAHAFSQGKPAVSLEEALEFESREQAQVHENLYMVTTSSSEQFTGRFASRHFGEFVPKLKASDYEYIIFDMPPVSQTSVTSKVSRFMDIVLMVVESGKTSKEVADRAVALLGESKASVATVLNKHQRYVPRWLLHEFD